MRIVVNRLDDRPQLDTWYTMIPGFVYQRKVGCSITKDLYIKLPAKDVGYVLKWLGTVDTPNASMCDMASPEAFTGTIRNDITVILGEGL